MWKSKDILNPWKDTETHKDKLDSAFTFHCHQPLWPAEETGDFHQTPESVHDPGLAWRKQDLQ